MGINSQSSISQTRCPFSGGENRREEDQETVRLKDMMADQSNNGRLGPKITYSIAADVKLLRSDPDHPIQHQQREALTLPDQDLPAKRAILSILIEEALKSFISEISTLTSDTDLVPIPLWDHISPDKCVRQRISSTVDPQALHRDLAIFVRTAQIWCESTINQHLASYFSEENRSNLSAEVRALLTRHENLNHMPRPDFTEASTRAQFDIGNGSSTAIAECLNMAAMITAKFAQANNGNIIGSEDFQIIFSNSQRFLNDLMTFSLGEFLHFDQKLFSPLQAPRLFWNSSNFFKLVDTDRGLSIELKKDAIQWSDEEAAYSRSLNYLIGVLQTKTGCPVLHSRCSYGAVMKPIYNWISCIWQRAVLDPVHTLGYYQVPPGSPQDLFS